MDDLETCPAIVHERHDEGFDQINVRAQGIENVVKVLPGHPLWGCFLDIGVAACLFSCKKHGFLFCGHHSFLRVRFFFSPTRPVRMKASSQLLPAPTSSPQGTRHAFLIF